ncbi:MAG: sensor histidine kinase [Eubacteriales bacterium]|nr:sensor histidine kinase [Eubacteriales bacterium]
MKDSRELRCIRLFLAEVNYMWTLFYALFAYAATQRIIKADSARAFIAELDVMPRPPLQTLLQAVVLSTVLFLLMTRVRKYVRGNVQFAMYAGAELELALFLLSAVSFDNTGILLVLAADWIVFDCDTRDKVVGMIILIAVYVLAGTQFWIPGLAKKPADIYLRLYAGWLQSALSILRSLVLTGTMMGFVFYLILAMRLAEKENERIRQLNRELDLANEHLRAANEKLEEYSRTVEVMSRTIERNRLAREIHDTLGHTLTGLISCIDASIALIDDSTEEVKKILARARDVARQGMVDVRRSVNALRPDALESLPLEEAVRRIMRDSTETGGVLFETEINLAGLRFDDDEEVTIYRIIQESITNAVTHGHARRIYVGLKKTCGAVEIHICDDGEGCRDLQKGFGLVHMQERAAFLGGTVEFDGQKGLHGNRGFTVKAQIPIRWGKEPLS